MGAAVALAAGDDGVPACADKRSGKISVVGKNGRCASGNFAITISGEAFKSSRNRTLTLNGIAFKRTGTLPQSITINGNSFRSSETGTLTINGMTFASSGNTLTINGIAASGGPGPTGPPGSAGPVGRIGPTGPPGIPGGRPPTEAPSPVPAQGGATTAIVEQGLTTAGPSHRVLVAGGANLVCSPCPDRLVTVLRLTRDGSPDPVVSRRIPTPAGPDGSSLSLNELIVTPAVCNPCTYALSLTVPAGGQGAANPTVTATDIRFGLVDLGPVASSP